MGHRGLLEIGFRRLQARFGGLLVILAGRVLTHGFDYGASKVPHTYMRTFEVDTVSEK